MSLFKKADVKNHLSARHRTEIHLQPESQADATGFPHEDNTCDQNAIEPVDGSPNPGGPATCDRIGVSPGCRNSAIKKRPGVTWHSVFLRDSCVLPDHV